MEHQYQTTEEYDNDGVFLGDRYTCVLCGKNEHLCTQRKNTNANCVHSDEFYNDCKQTKILSNEEYNGIPYNFQEHIQKLVNKEAWKFADIPTPEIPKVGKVQVKKNSVWWWNFFKSSVLQIVP